MKNSFFFALLLLFIFATSAMATPLALPRPSPSDVKRIPVSPAPQTQVSILGKRQSGPAIPLPEAGETLLSFLDRLLANMPLLSKLMAGLGYVRPK
ncbi:hypothetical protein IWW37_005776 [Coemansia sp. RSA 2050]|nr:hypothetical protein IWW37_005776 [Coemansia sp. RSA 2050]KAJ2729156.1 hypothetical protein IW152_005721 [Coemansia sp. BCRC 34962]